jgi:hypothetical protein
MPSDSIPSNAYSRRICEAIRRVFLEVWDPIGIGDEPNAQDEYDMYVDHMFELLTARASDVELAKYLDWIVGQMGMDSSPHSIADVIHALRTINLRELQR